MGCCSKDANPENVCSDAPCAHYNERDWFRLHAKPRALSECTKVFLRTKIRQNAVGTLDEVEIDHLIDAACYYEFKAGEIVTRQYSQRYTQAFIERGSLDKIANGFRVGSISPAGTQKACLDPSKGVLAHQVISCNPPYTFMQEHPLWRQTHIAAEDTGIWGIDINLFGKSMAAARSRRKASEFTRIHQFLDTCGHFSGLSVDQKKQIVQSSYTWSFKGNAPLLLQGCVCELARGIIFVMSGEVSVNGCVDLVTGSSIRAMANLFASHPLQRIPCSMAAKSNGRLLFLRFDELGSTLADDLANRLETLDRGRPKLTDFLPVRLLGEGGFGSVTLVQHEHDGAKYALKKVLKNNGNGSDVIAQECDLLRETRHPFLLDFEATLETDDCVCVITELLSGGDLFDLTSRVKRAFSREEASFVVGSIAIALNFLHGKGIVHRDLKPENVMIDCWGYVRLIDLGAATKIGNCGKIFTVAGHPLYNAPEVYCKHGYDMSVDLWALGVILYDLVCTCLPFGMNHAEEDAIKTIKSVRKGILTFPHYYQDMDGQNVMRGLLMKNPNERLACRDLDLHAFFQFAGVGNLFSKLSRFEIESPLIGIDPKSAKVCWTTVAAPMQQEQNCTLNSDI